LLLELPLSIDVLGCPPSVIEELAGVKQDKDKGGGKGGTSSSLIISSSIDPSTRCFFQLFSYTVLFPQGYISCFLVPPCHSLQSLNMKITCKAHHVRLVAVVWLHIYKT